MLILTRKPGESFFMTGRIKITILDSRGDEILVGIDAPQNINIYREEIAPHFDEL
jgi:carbon storage regulator